MERGEEPLSFLFYLMIFIDLKEFSLSQILKLYMTKYPNGSEFIALKSLTYVLIKRLLIPNDPDIENISGEIK